MRALLPWPSPFTAQPSPTAPLPAARVADGAPQSTRARPRALGLRLLFSCALPQWCRGCCSVAARCRRRRRRRRSSPSSPPLPGPTIQAPPLRRRVHISVVFFLLLSLLQHSPPTSLPRDKVLKRLGVLGSPRAPSVRRNAPVGRHDALHRRQLPRHRYALPRLLSEYGEGCDVSALGDVYSLGILLLELFTGRSPTDEMFKDSLDLHKLAEAALPNRASEIADPAIWLHEEAKEKDHPSATIMRSRNERCLVSVIGLGVSCSNQQPRQRTPMRDAATEMRAIRDAYLLAG